MPNWTRMITPASMQYSRGWLGSCNKECYILSKRNHNLETFASKQLWPQWRGIRGFLSKSCASCFFDKSYVYLISVLSPSQYMFFHLIVSGITRMSLRKKSGLLTAKHIIWLGVHLFRGRFGNNERQWSREAL